MVNQLTTDRLLPAYTWAVAEVNSPLQSQKEVDEAVELLDKAGLPHHGDRPKDWDNLIALAYAGMHVDPNGLVLDAGAGDGSAFLPGLRRLGFRNLVGCNIDIRGQAYVDGIGYEYGNIEALRFGANTISFIGCFSVIEHGVDVSKFLAEAARTLKPGGCLFISTDYWHSPIDTGDRVAFGAPVKIFSYGDLVALSAIALDQGLRLTTTARLECNERVIDWIGLSYTFVNLLFRKLP
jgi:SAM-dependent methyltransferase